MTIESLPGRTSVCLYIKFYLWNDGYHPKVKKTNFYWNVFKVHTEMKFTSTYLDFFFYKDLLETRRKKEALACIQDIHSWIKQSKRNKNPEMDKGTNKTKVPQLEPIWFTKYIIERTWFICTKDQDHKLHKKVDLTLSTANSKNFLHVTDHTMPLQVPFFFPYSSFSFG